MAYYLALVAEEILFWELAFGQVLKKIGTKNWKMEAR